MPPDPPQGSPPPLIVPIDLLVREVGRNQHQDSDEYPFGIKAALRRPAKLLRKVSMIVRLIAVLKKKQPKPASA